MRSRDRIPRVPLVEPEPFRMSRLWSQNFSSGDLPSGDLPPTDLPAASCVD
jgi:hypothetical protein